MPAITTPSGLVEGYGGLKVPELAAGTVYTVEEAFNFFRDLATSNGLMEMPDAGVAKEPFNYDRAYPGVILRGGVQPVIESSTPKAEDPNRERHPALAFLSSNAFLEHHEAVTARGVYSVDARTLVRLVLEQSVTRRVIFRSGGYAVRDSDIPHDQFELVNEIADLYRDITPRKVA